jgi:hypothetical protein
VADAGRDVAVVPDAGCDVAVKTLVEVAAKTSAPCLARCGRSRMAAAMRRRGGVVVSRQTVMDQCLATGGCQTLQLLIIRVLIIN